MVQKCGPSKVQRYKLLTFLVSRQSTPKGFVFEPNISLVRLILIMQNPECFLNCLLSKNDIKERNTKLILNFRQLKRYKITNRFYFGKPPTSTLVMKQNICKLQHVVFGLAMFGEVTNLFSVCHNLLVLPSNI